MARADETKDKTMAVAASINTPVRASAQDGVLANLMARYARYRTYRTTLEELSALSNRELADLGMNRSQLRAIAWSVAYEQVSDLAK